MTDIRILKSILTPRQYEVWEFKKNIKKVYNRTPTQREIGLVFGISQVSVCKIFKRINEKLSKCKGNIT
jgi:DNA-directed RNA polymerase specialized sigma subunit